MPEEKIAIVTGGMRGIGRACAEVLAEEGRRVVIADIDEAGAAETAGQIGRGAVACRVDMASEDEILALFDRVEADLGPASILVNNAGIGAPAPFLDLKPEDFRRVIDVNLTGSFIALQRAARTMVEQAIKGAVVNMSSVNAVMAIPEIAAYCASKGGVGQLTKAAAMALAPHGIRVNAVGPGSIDTAMMAGVNASEAAMARVMTRTPLKRIGAPREIAEIVAFLASDKASYVTGETIYADGGRMALNYTC